MSTLPPNQIGILVSLFVAYAYCNILSIFETVMMPLLIGKEERDISVQSNFGYPLLACVSVTSALSFFVYRRILDTSASNTPLHEIGDRSFLFVSLIMGILGCSLLIKNQSLSLGTTIGLSLMGISLMIGMKSIYSLYTKIIGVAFGSAGVSEAGNSVSLYDR